MKICFYLAHPAHYHYFKNAINILVKNGHCVKITIKKKDVLESLLDEDNIEYKNILREGRRGTKIGILKGLLQRTFKHFQFLKKENIELVISSSAELGPITKFHGISFINAFEDDLTLFPWYTKIFGPFIDCLLVPKSCSTSSLEHKTIKYNGYQELAYLHPNYFKPNFKKVKKYLKSNSKNYLIRFSKLDAWHDSGVKGLNEDLFEEIVKILEPNGNIIISSESPLNKKFDKYIVDIPATDMHHLLYYSDMYIGDSQTMTAEAAVLGTPALRFNDFVGKLGYLEELEEQYELTYGIKTTDQAQLLDKIKYLAEADKIKEEWSKKREFMLSNTIDVTAYLVWFIENYPSSRNELISK